MTRPAFAVVLPALLLSALTSAAAAVPPADEQLARLADAEVARAYPGGAPGAAVLVKRGGAVVLRKGYGLPQLDFEVPVAPEHVFEIGSVTKRFTAAAILRLAEQGRLSLAGGEVIPVASVGEAIAWLREHGRPAPTPPSRPPSSPAARIPPTDNGAERMRYPSGMSNSSAHRRGP